MNARTLATWFGVMLAAACGSDGVVVSQPDAGVADAAQPAADAGADAAAPTHDAAATDTAEDAADDAGADVAQPAPPYPELRVGPYEHGVQLLVDSLRSTMQAYNTSTSYSHSASQGYVLQAVALLLDHSLGYELPGGEATRDELAAMALVEVAELRDAADRTVGGGPAFGLVDAWDAFQDGSTNPAYTAYTWQSGMVALGCARLLQYFDHAGDRHADLAAEVEDLRTFAHALVDYWAPYYTAVSDGGFYWYSDRPADAIAVHNTSVLIAEAATILARDEPASELYLRGKSAADLLEARLRSNSGRIYWNYADEGYPHARAAEDISHALVTLQFARFARDQGWWTDAQMASIARTLRELVWSANPMRMNGRIDGGRRGEAEWIDTRAATIGWAAHGDSPGGDIAIFDYARSLAFTTLLAAPAVPLEGGTTGAVGVLALARLATGQPPQYDETVRMIAGPNDLDVGTARFYTVDWDNPRTVTVGGLGLPARASTELNANVLIDRPEDDDSNLIVSFVWQSGTDGEVGVWDGDRYRRVTSLPATIAQDGTVRWARTTFELAPPYFDYQPSIAGTNILLQVTNRIALSEIEVTPR